MGLLFVSGVVIIATTTVIYQHRIMKRELDEMSSEYNTETVECDLPYSTF